MRHRLLYVIRADLAHAARADGLFGLRAGDFLRELRLLARVGVLAGVPLFGVVEQRAEYHGERDEQQSGARSRAGALGHGWVTALAHSLLPSDRMKGWPNMLSSASE